METGQTQQSGTQQAAGAAAATAAAAAAAAGATQQTQQSTTSTSASQAGQQSQAQGGAQASQAQGQQQTTADAQSTVATKEQAKPAAQAWDGIKLPDGVQAKKSLVDSFTKTAKEIGMPQDQAQKLAEWWFKSSADETKAQQQADDQAFKKLVADDETALKADPEFGGINFDKTTKAADSFLAQFFGEKAAKLLADAGLHRNPDLVKGLARARAVIAEDKAPFPKKDAPAAGGRREYFQKLFPNSPSMWPAE